MGTGDGVDLVLARSSDGSVLITDAGAVNFRVAATVGDIFVIASGDASGTTDSANVASAIARAAALTVDGLHHNVRLGIGVFYFAAPIVQPHSRVGIIGAGRTATILRPAYAGLGGPDAQLNALILSRAAISGAALGTVTVGIQTDDVQFTSSVGLTPNDWYLLLSTSAQTGYPGMTFGATTLRGETIQVRSVVGLVASTYRPLLQWRGAGSSIYAMTPLVDVNFEDFDIDLVGSTVATGIYVQGADGLYLDMSCGGASRMSVEAQYCVFAPGGGVYNRGGNNSPFYCNSSHYCGISHAFDPDSTLGYAHPTLGIPRGVQYVNQSTRPWIRGQIGKCTSLERKGVYEAVWDVQVIDLDFTERDLRDPNLFGFPGTHIAGAVMNCSNPSSTESEVPINEVGSIRMLNCRVPDPTNLGLEFGALFVDSVLLRLDLLEITSDGRDPTTPGAYCSGAAFYDTAAYDSAGFTLYRTDGIQYAFAVIQGGNRITIGRWEHSPSVLVGTTMISYGQTATLFFPFWVQELVLRDAPAFFIFDNAASNPINHNSLRDFHFDVVELVNVGRWTNVRICHDTHSGDAVPPATAQGDVVERVQARACTLDNTTDFFTLAGHSFPNDMPVYIGGQVAPTGGGGFAFGDVSYVIQSDFSTFNGTFKVSASIGGVARDFTSNGTNLTITAGVVAIGVPQTVLSFDKGLRIDGPGFGVGISRPIGYTIVAFGDGLARFAAGVRPMPNDQIEPTVASYDAAINNASVAPLGFAKGKPAAAAGTSQIDRSPA